MSAANAANAAGEGLAEGGHRAKGPDDSGLDDEVLGALVRSGVLPAGVVAAFGTAHPALRVESLTGGVSSDIWRVRWHDDAGAHSVVVKRALARLRVAADWRAPTGRNAAEVAWLQTVAAVLPDAVPKVIAHEPDLDLFVMNDFAPDAYPVWKSLLRDGDVQPAFAAQMGAALARIHAATADDPRLATRFANDAWFHALRLEPYLEAMARPDGAHAALADALFALSRDTLAHHRVLVHGDVSPKNILAGSAGPVFLDAECAWYGDAAFDLAFCLNHLLLKCLWRPAHAPALLAGFDALAAAYLDGVRWEPPAAVEARTARLLPALLLARVDGKSPVEYLTDPALRQHVRGFAVPRVRLPPQRLAAIRDAWASALPQGH